MISTYINTRMDDEPCCRSGVWGVSLFLPLPAVSTPLLLINLSILICTVPEVLNVQISLGRFSPPPAKVAYLRGETMKLKIIPLATKVLPAL